MNIFIAIANAVGIGGQLVGAAPPPPVGDFLLDEAGGQFTTEGLDKIILE
jgi:hypothetical protein